MRDGAVVLESPDPPPGPPRVPTGLALLVTSSGTTGLPKNVMLPHRALVANLGQMRHAHKLTGDDVVMAALPLYHVFALQVSLNLALLQGATVVILPPLRAGHVPPGHPGPQGHQGRGSPPDGAGAGHQGGGRGL